MALTGSKSVYLTAAPGISPYSQRTIALWVKMPPTATATNSLFSLYYGVSFGYQFNLHFAGNPTPNVFGAIAQSNNGTTIDGTGLSGIANAPWHFVLATFDNGGVTGNVKTVSIYYDGVLSQAVTVGGPVTQLVDDDPGSTNYIWPGSVDGNAQVAYPMIWKRLLTQGEITALAVSGADPRTVAPSQLVSFAQLNQGSGTIPDLVGPSINWVVTGGTFTVVADPFQLPQPIPPIPPTPPNTGSGMSNNPFQPIKFVSGPPTKVAWESGPSVYAPYNGQAQTALINTANPPPPMEDGPYYGDGQGITAHGQPIGSGLAAIEHQTTQFPGPAQAVAAGTPAELTWSVDSSGNLHSHDNVTNKSF